MLPEDVALKTGQEHVRLVGNGLGDVRLGSLDELHQWVVDNERKLGRVHMVMYFACLNSGRPRSWAVGSAFVEDNGIYVAIRATGEGQGAIDALLAAAEAHKKSLQG